MSFQELIEANKKYLSLHYRTQSLLSFVHDFGAEGLLKILAESNGRRIIFTQPADRLDGTEYRYAKSKPKNRKFKPAEIKDVKKALKKLHKSGKKNKGNQI